MATTTGVCGYLCLRTSATDLVRELGNKNKSFPETKISLWISQAHHPIRVSQMHNRILYLCDCKLPSLSRGLTGYVKTNVSINYIKLLYTQYVNGVTPRRSGGSPPHSFPRWAEASALSAREPQYEDEEDIALTENANIASAKHVIDHSNDNSIKGLREWKHEDQKHPKQNKEIRLVAKSLNEVRRNPPPLLTPYANESRLQPRSYELHFFLILRVYFNFLYAFYF